MLKFVYIFGLLMLNVENSVHVHVLDENRCSRFEYEYKILERIIFLENKNTDLERGQMVLTRKVEELVELLKEQRVEMEGKDREIEEVIGKLNNSQHEAHKKLETQLTETLKEQNASLEKEKNLLEEMNRDQDARHTELRNDMERVTNSLHTSINLNLNRTVNGFTAQLSGDRKDTGTNTIAFDLVLTNDLSAYNPSTGVFTAPVAGQFLFSLTIFAHGIQPWAQIYVNKSKEIGRVYADGQGGGSSYDTACVTVITDLAKGDQVSVRYGGSSWYNELHTNRWNTFSGVYIK